MFQCVVVVVWARRGRPCMRWLLVRQTIPTTCSASWFSFQDPVTHTHTFITTVTTISLLLFSRPYALPTTLLHQPLCIPPATKSNRYAHDPLRGPSATRTNRYTGQPLRYPNRYATPLRLPTVTHTNRCAHQSLRRPTVTPASRYADQPLRRPAVMQTNRYASQPLYRPPYGGNLRTNVQESFMYPLPECTSCPGNTEVHKRKSQ